MTTGEKIDILKTVCTFISAMSTPFFVYWIRKLEKNTNSKLDKLVELKGQAGEALGNLAGRKELKQEQKEEKIEKINLG